MTDLIFYKMTAYFGEWPSLCSNVVMSHQDWSKISRPFSQSVVCVDPRVILKCNPVKEVIFNDRTLICSKWLHAEDRPIFHTARPISTDTVLLKSNRHLANANGHASQSAPVVVLTCVRVNNGFGPLSWLWPTIWVKMFVFNITRQIMA